MSFPKAKEGVLEYFIDNPELNDETLYACFIVAIENKHPSLVAYFSTRSDFIDRKHGKALKMVCTTGDVSMFDCLCNVNKSQIIKHGCVGICTSQSKLELLSHLISTYGEDIVIKDAIEIASHKSLIVLHEKGLLKLEDISEKAVYNASLTCTLATFELFEKIGIQFAELKCFEDILVSLSKRNYIAGLTFFIDKYANSIRRTNILREVFMHSKMDIFHLLVEKIFHDITPSEVMELACQCNSKDVLRSMSGLHISFKYQSSYFMSIIIHDADEIFMFFLKEPEFVDDVNTRGLNTSIQASASKVLGSICKHFKFHEINVFNSYRLAFELERLDVTELLRKSFDLGNATLKANNYELVGMASVRTFGELMHLKPEGTEDLKVLVEKLIQSRCVHNKNLFLKSYSKEEVVDAFVKVLGKEYFYDRIG